MLVWRRFLGVDGFVCVRMGETTRIMTSSAFAALMFFGFGVVFCRPFCSAALALRGCFGLGRVCVCACVRVALPWEFCEWGNGGLSLRRDLAGHKRPEPPRPEHAQWDFNFGIFALAFLPSAFLPWHFCLRHFCLFCLVLGRTFSVCVLPCRRASALVVCVCVCVCVFVDFASGGMAGCLCKGTCRGTNVLSRHAPNTRSGTSKKLRKTFFLFIKEIF
jgi:hypothetical protein